MRSTIKSSAAGALCAALAVTVLPSETWAGPTSVSSPAVVSLSSQVENVHYYRHHRRYHRHYHYGYRYRHYGYYPYYYNPAAAVVGAAAGLATAPLWGWGYPYYGYPYRPWWY